MNRLVALCLFTIASTNAFADTSGPAANAYRAYPPSCLSDPLTYVPSGPGNAPAVILTAYTPATGTFSSETVGFNLWRVPCSGGKSALLGQIVRSAANNGRTDVFPLIPTILGSQGNLSNAQVRVAIEPNTVRSNIPPGLGLTDSIEVVFENFPAETFDFSQAITLTVIQAAGLPNVSVQLPAYDPSQYPAASQPLPITGYLAGNFFDPAHGGEGVEIFVGFDTGTSRLITAAWYTYDSTGTPFWLFGQGGFNAGDTSATLTLVYATDGGFAGNFGPSATNHPWGTVTVSFPNCGTLHFQYQANAGLESGVPQGSGTKTWTKLFGLNALTCD